MRKIRAELIETSSTHAQAGGGTGSVECAGVEILEKTTDEIGRQAVNELFLCTPGSIGSIVCLRQSSTMGALPPTPRSFPHWANGLFAKSVAARGKPCRNTEVSAPLATSTAPVALRQSRILRTMAYSHLKSPQHQSFQVRSCRNPVLLRLRCLVLNRLCLVLLRQKI